MNPALQRLWRGSLNLFLLFVRLHLWRIHPRRFLTDLKAIPIRKPIFLLGVQGGGLTLIARMLRRHPDVVSVTGNASFWAGPDEMQNVMGPLLPPALTGLHHKIPPHPQYPERDWLYAIDELLPIYRKTSADATEEMARQFQRALRIALAIHARDASRARFVDKSQTFTVRLSLINALLREYEPRFVLITRNPYAMCLRAATRVHTFQRLPLTLEERLELAAQHWANSFRCALQDAEEVQYFTIMRFEDVLQEPEQQIRELCAFVHLEFSPEMLPAPGDRFPLGSTGSSRGDHKWYPLRLDVNRPYLDALTPRMVDVINSRVEELARCWGYTPEGP